MQPSLGHLRRLLHGGWVARQGQAGNVVRVYCLRLRQRAGMLSRSGRTALALLYQENFAGEVTSQTLTGAHKKTLHCALKPEVIEE